LPGKQNYLGESSCQVKSVFPWQLRAAKETILVGRDQQPSKDVYLAGHGCQGNNLTWQGTTAKENI